jgi:DNA-binding transcriptional regulator YiaG
VAVTFVVDTWTGARAAALRAALRMSNESFAEHLGTRQWSDRLAQLAAAA